VRDEVLEEHRRLVRRGRRIRFLEQAFVFPRAREGTPSLRGARGCRRTTAWRKGSSSGR
jgi:hypothetical protein